MPAVPRLTHHRRLIALPLILIAVALLAAACSDDDFDAAPEDRGGVAAAAVGVVEPSPSQQAAEAAASEDRAGAPAADADAVEPVPSEQSTDTVARTEEELFAVARGEDLFFANGCSVCHGDTGGGGIGPAIAKTQLSLSAVIKQYRNPRELMPPFPADRVSDDDVADIYAFLQSLE